MTEAELIKWLTGKVMTLTTSRASIDPDEPFASHGMDSVSAVGLSGDIEVELGIAVSPLILYDYPTVKSLARYLSSTMPTAGEGRPPVQS